MILSKALRALEYSKERASGSMGSGELPDKQQVDGLGRDGQGGLEDWSVNTIPFGFRFLHTLASTKFLPLSSSSPSIRARSQPKESPQGLSCHLTEPVPGLINWRRLKCFG